jgi:uncharacterized protein
LQSITRNRTLIKLRPFVDGLVPAGPGLIATPLGLWRWFSLVSRVIKGMPYLPEPRPAMLITEPYFYLVSIPAILLLGISKSGFGAGFGSLAVPMMALAVSVPQAVAICMPLLLVMDVLGIVALRKEFDKALLKFLLPFALMGTAVGTLLFTLLSASTVAAIVGLLTLLFLAQRLFFPPKETSRPFPRWVGGLLTTVSGFTSFVAHAGGPPISAYMIPLKLKPIVFTATMAYLFFFVNLSKWGPYAWLGLFTRENLFTSIALLPLAPMGVWIGVRIARTIDAKLFYRLVYLGMFLTAIKLIWDGVVS